MWGLVHCWSECTTVQYLLKNTLSVKHGVTIQSKNYYLARKLHEVQIHTKTWINLENTMLNERIQIKRPYIVLFLLYKMSRIYKSTETESILVFTWVWEGKPGVCVNRYRVPFQDDEDSLELDNSDACVTSWTYWKPWNGALTKGKCCVMWNIYINSSVPFVANNS